MADCPLPGSPLDGASRALTDGERAIVRAVFGDAVDPDPVRLHRRKWWPLQPRSTIMAPTGALWFHPRGDCWTDDFARAPLADRGLFVHEMVHIWQHQKGIFLPLARHPFCRYSYHLVPGRPLERYGIEQQAEIVRHAYMISEGAIIRGAPPLAQYVSVLTFSPGW